jgi:hypothetical protein
MNPLNIFKSVYLKPILILLSSYLRLCLPCGLLPSGFPIKIFLRILYISLVSFISSFLIWSLWQVYLVKSTISYRPIMMFLFHQFHFHPPADCFQTFWIYDDIINSKHQRCHNVWTLLLQYRKSRCILSGVVSFRNALSEVRAPKPAVQTQSFIFYTSVLTGKILE